jgi:5-methylcytosine-specific restriction endonuclease McrA
MQFQGLSPIGYKLCPKCLSTKLFLEFYKDTKQCKECKRIAALDRYYRNKDKRIQKARVWKEQNRERMEKTARLYKEKHKGAISRQKRIHRLAHKKEITKYNQEYYRKNVERERERQKKYCKENPEIFRECTRRRRARKRGIKIVNLTGIQWKEIKEYFDGRCAYCFKKCDQTQDHLIAISSGGNHTKYNVVPACISCNSSKGKKNLREWLNVPYPNSTNKTKIYLQHLG